MKRYPFHSRLFSCAALLLSACGNPLADQGQVIDVAVFGVYESPDTATGNQSPKFYEMTFTKIDLVTSDGETVTFEPEDPGASVRIIDRPQILLTEDISDYDEATFTSGTVTFGYDVVVGGKYQSDYALSLESNTVSTTESFTVEKSKSLRVEVEINWLNTIVRDEDTETEAIEQPSFTVSTESQ